MAKVQGAIVVDIQKCKGCGLCVPACPAQVIRLAPAMNSKGYRYAFMEHPGECTGCANCSLVCPDTVITVYRVKANAVN